MYIELLETAYRNNPYEWTSNATWETTRLVCANGAKVSISNNGEMVAARYTSTGQTRLGALKELVTSFVAKKIAEVDRTVIIWRMCYSPAQDDADTPSHALTDETGWIVVTKVPEGVPDRRPGTALVQTCGHLVPLIVDGDVADSGVRAQLAIGEFTNVVLSATELHFNRFENAFQQLALGTRNQLEDGQHGDANKIDTFLACV